VTALRLRASTPAALVVAVLLAACGSDDPGPATTVTVTTAPAASEPAATTDPAATTTAPADGIDPMDDASTDPVTVVPTNAETALLTDVRAARHEGYDRVVFVFRNVVPGYEVQYVDRPIIQDGSGDAVTVAGDATVQVRMESALDADLDQPSAPATYTGPTRFSPGTPEIAELVRTGGFEGVLTWAVGLTDRVDFRVSALQDPPRLVIDFRNH
jgi:hypothetical protein